MSSEPSPSTSRVVAVLVVSDGAEWLPGVLATLARARFDGLELVAVDNASTDSSPELLAKRLDRDRILRLDERTGFGRAVGAALAHFEQLADCDHVLLLHDDLVLAPDAIGHLVKALDGDETLAVVGCKLREWSSDRLLQQVGMTVDRLGRAETVVEVGELDQGQHDAQAGVLYVSTAGMLLRRSVFRDVGGFDVRFPAFRDDLDLCWRAWLAGMRVEVVPAAVGYHIAAAARGARKVGGGRDWEPRYLAERHSLATLLKNYGLPRLAVLLPVVLLIGVAKLVAFAATRRFGDALATVAAYGWNVVQLPQTLRRRRQVQRRRARTDGELAHLFAPGLPRLRSYGEALGSWLAGGSTRALIDDSDLARSDPDDGGGLAAAVRGVRAHPVATVGTLLGLCYLLGVVPLLGGGQIVGGQVAPWPESAGDFLNAYANPWTGDPLASALASSPIQAVLGLVALAGGGSAWLAQRLVVLGLLPLAWVLTLRAGRLITGRAAPRVLGATLYVLSPVLLGSLAQGRFGLLVVAALLPGLLLVGVRAADGQAPAAAGWRASALLALGLAVAGSADPALLPIPATLLACLLVYSLLRKRPGRAAASTRLALAAVAAGLLLAGWLAGLAGGAWRTLPAAESAPLPLWRALGLVPALLPGLDGLAGWLLALTSAAVLLAAILLGLRVRPAVVAGLLLAWTAAAVAAWGLARLPATVFWPPALLVPAALAQAGLAVLAARWLQDGLAAYDFGLRQLITVTTAIVLLVGLGGGMIRLATGPWSGLAVSPQLVPAFVGGDEDRVGPYRVLLLDPTADGRVRWAVSAASGPDMTSFGAMPSPGLLTELRAAVGGVLEGSGATPGAELGRLNVRYIVVRGEPSSTREVLAALDSQPLLEPLPAGEAPVYRVRPWLPRAVVLPAAAASALQSSGDPGESSAREEAGLGRRDSHSWVGTDVPDSGGLLLLSEGRSSGWEGQVEGTPLERVDVGGLNGFAVPAGAERVEIVYGGQAAHLAIVAAQVLVALALASVALRPPGSAAARVSPGALELPGELSEDDVAPPMPVATRARHLAPEDPEDGPEDGPGDDAGSVLARPAAEGRHGRSG